MTENAASCARCGSTYHEDEFGVDHDGYLVSLHLCDPRVMRAFRRKIPKSPPQRSDQMRQNFSGIVTCIDCGIVFEGWKIQLRCTACAEQKNRETALARYHRKKGAA